MRVPLSWLRELCDPGMGAAEIAELLAARAVEVERVSRVGPPSAEGYVVGRVLGVEPHPDADRLSVCSVDAGDGERTIVCGAPNVAAGQAVPVALPGAVLASGERLGRAKLRGVVSDGMILAEDELGMGEDHSGILVLAGESGPAPGTPLGQVLPFADEVLELDLNPNRSDCLGVYGVARELHAITGAPLAPAPWEADVEPSGERPVEELASVRVEVPELCPRFTVRAFADVRMGPSPPALRARLAAAGQRPISNVVDVTNYVMLLVGQPLHAFDLDLVPDGEIVVRRARDGERMITLDGQERVLDAETVLVCDRDRPAGIAGIMGGQVSEVSEATSRVLLEVATWDGVNVLRTSNVLGLRTEASARFEKQLHPELALRAQRVASRMLTKLSGATLAPGTIDVAAEVPAPHVISLHASHVEGLLGAAIPAEEAAGHLRRLGFGVEPAGGDALEVAVPPERHYDVTREVDLVEEVARLHGLDRLPRTLPSAAGRRGGLGPDARARRAIEDAMCGLGLDQVISWTLVSPALADRLRLPADDERRRAVRVANPLGEEASLVRTTLLGGLLDAARHNAARGSDELALFELGRVALAEPAPTAGGPAAGEFPGEMPAPVREPLRVAALCTGPLAPESWRGERRAADFFDVKGIAEALAESLGARIELQPGAEPFLHPGRAALARAGGVEIGWIGELHPAVARAWGIAEGAGFELDLAPMLAVARAPDLAYEDLMTHPAVLQDLAVVVPDEIPAETVRAAVESAGGELLRSARIFDLYRGEQVPAGHKSLALRLEFRAADRTLTDEEVGERRATIAAALEGLGGSLRA